MPTLKIRHTHTRRFDASPAQLATLIDQAWTRGPRDAFPHDRIRPWRKDPPGAQGWVAGASRFGHGPFAFLVERWDGQVLRAKIETPGFTGWHGFELRADGAGTVLIHDLQADVSLVPWLVWRAAIGQAHDWAVESLFDRLEHILREGHAPPATARPLPTRSRLIIRGLSRKRARPATAATAM